jgi:hypothetical protein
MSSTHKQTTHTGVKDRSAKVRTSLERLSCGSESGYGRKDIAGDLLLVPALVHHDTGGPIQLVLLLLI